MTRTPGEPAPRTFLDRLELRNFRQFGTISTSLERGLTVFVARNGGGKTALLDAIAIALGYFVDTFRDPTHQGFEKTDIRLVQTPEGQMVQQPPVVLDASGEIEGRPLNWQRKLETETGRTTYKEASELRDAAKALQRDLQDYADGRSPTPPSLPVVAYYGTGRLWSTGRLTKGREEVATRFNHQVDAYANCLKPESTYGDFVAWFEAVIREAQNETTSGVPSPHRPRGLLEALRRATDRVLEPTGWGHLDWDFLAGEMVAKHPTQGRMSVSLLSDGIRNLIALVADLAHRSVRLNPHFAGRAPERTPGIVLIDEVDMHLHPGWQQGILASLRAAFPLVQFIVTTHSPQLLSTVDSKCIRIIEETPAGWTTRMPVHQTRGVTRSDVLSAVMEVDPIPDVPEWKTLRRYRGLIEDGLADGEEALRLRAELERFYGTGHPVILDCGRLIRFVAFKKKTAGDA